jgi:hypothetical protein
MYKASFKEYEGNHLAHTLSPDYLGKHDNGWEVEGEIHSDYYQWVNEFEARNGDMWVKGDFENEVCASSEEVYEEFIKLFPPEDWDYWDI